MLYSVNWPNFIAWIALPIEILDNMYIAIVYFPRYDAKNFEINLIFLIKPLLVKNKIKTKIWKPWEWKKFLI